MNDHRCQNPNCPFTEPHWHSIDRDPADPANWITTTHWVSYPQRIINRPTNQQKDHHDSTTTTG